MVKIERTPIPPASLAVEKQKACGSYTKPDVTEQLSQDFHNKCYLCEISLHTELKLSICGPMAAI